MERLSSADAVLDAYSAFLTGKTMSANTIMYNSLPDIEKSTICEICHDAIKAMELQGPLLRLKSQICVIGDIHGNFVDLIRLIHVFGVPPASKYLFLGDYVDRGSHSIHVIALLLALFVKYPQSVTLLRGNHEFSHINKVYGFYSEIMEIYGDEDLWILFQSVFSMMPISAIIDDSVFCVHGGLSPQLTYVSQISQLDLPITTYEELPMVADLVWSDPDENGEGYKENLRGAGVTYGKDVTRTFLQNNGLKLVVRAHQCIASGAATFSTNLGVTVFSSSDYLTFIKNRCGALLFRAGGNVDFYSFSSDESFDFAPYQTMKLAPKQLGLRATQNATNTQKNVMRKPGHISIPSSPVPVRYLSTAKKNSPVKMMKQHTEIKPKVLTADIKTYM